MAATRQGWLTKQGGRIKSWKKRWCVLDETALHYFKAEGGQKQGDIPIKSFGTVRAAHSSKKFTFKIVTNQREYMFSCDDQNDMSAWVEALSLARKHVKGSETSFEGNFKKIGESDFEKLRVVGQGSFGKVLQVRHKQTGQIYAMKVLNKKTVVERDDVKSIQTEKSILMKLSSPFLVKLYSSFQTPDKLYFVMDYINGGELFHHLQAERNFAPTRARFYCAEIVLGLEYLHKRGIIYRDLKPENILLTAEGHVCLTDFGISKEGLSCKSARTATFCGTPEYLAPEVLLGQEYGQEIDYWSLGTILYEMLTSTPPFYSEDVQLMYQKILNDTIDFEEIPDKATQGIILAFLERDPAKRLTKPAAIKAHPYFASIDWAKLEKREVLPPFVPPVKDKTDVSQFDEEFTRQPVHSLVQGSELCKSIQEQFRGFSYYGDSLVSTPTDGTALLVDGQPN